MSLGDTVTAVSLTDGRSKHNEKLYDELRKPAGQVAGVSHAENFVRAGAEVFNLLPVPTSALRRAREDRMDLMQRIAGDTTPTRETARDTPKPSPALGGGH